MVLILNIKYVPRKEWFLMTSKELLYIEDALGHECFMKTCSKYTAQQLNDVSLSTYIGELEQKHTEIFNKFLNLL